MGIGIGIGIDECNLNTAIYHTIHIYHPPSASYVIIVVIIIIVEGKPRIGLESVSMNGI